MRLKEPIERSCSVCLSGFLRYRNRGNMDICTPCQRKSRVAKWRSDNPDRCRENRSRWVSENAEKDRKAKAGWSKRNWSYELAKAAAYRAKKRNAMPVWADSSKINNIYAGCPNGFHVDHVIPLQGRKVSGLHVENNLQYLSAYENRSKSNHFEANP